MVTSSQPFFFAKPKIETGEKNGKRITCGIWTGRYVSQTVPCDVGLWAGCSNEWLSTFVGSFNMEAWVRLSQPEHCRELPLKSDGTQGGCPFVVQVHVF
jgi:hypothetical protein